MININNELNYKYFEYIANDKTITMLIEEIQTL